MARKIKATIRSYRGLDESFTQVANSMLTYIKDPYAFKIYFYLCMRYNGEYSVCSLSDISSSTEISLKKTKDCIKDLCEKGYISKVKYERNGNASNKYEVFYETDAIVESDVCYVYIHKEKTTGKVLYVGKGTGDRAYNLRDRNKKYLEYIHDFGRSNIQIEIVKTFNNHIEAYSYEKDLTIKFKDKNEADFNIVIGNPSTDF